MKKKLVTFGISYCIVFLNVFMTIIFGPAEIFMGNYKDFGVIYSEFGWTFLIGGIILAECFYIIGMKFPIA